MAISVDALNQQAELEIHNLLQQFYQASTNGSLDFFNNHFQHVDTTFIKKFSTWIPLPIEESVFIGTDPGEFILTHANIKNFWGSIFSSLQGGLPLLMGDNVMISGDDRVAWVTDQPTMVLKRPYKCRLTAVLMRKQEGSPWMFTHAHLSLGVPNEDILGFFTPKETSQLAQTNQPAIILSTIVFLKKQQIAVSDWVSSVGDSLLPFWAPLNNIQPPKERITPFANTIALNFASFGATIKHLKPDGTGIAIELTWPLDNLLTSFPGTTWEDMDEVLKMFAFFAQNVGLKYSGSRALETITIKVTT